MSSVKPRETLANCYNVDFSEPYFVSMGSSIFDLTDDDFKSVPTPDSESKIDTVSSINSNSDSFSTAVSISASYGCFGGKGSMAFNKSSSSSKNTMRTDVTITATKYRVTGNSKFIVEPHTFLNADLQQYIADGDISMEKLEKSIGTFYCR